MTPRHCWAPRQRPDPRPRARSGAGSSYPILNPCEPDAEAWPSDCQSTNPQIDWGKNWGFLGSDTVLHKAKEFKVKPNLKTCTEAAFVHCKNERFKEWTSVKCTEVVLGQTMRGKNLGGPPARNFYALYYRVLVEQWALPDAFVTKFSKTIHLNWGLLHGERVREIESWGPGRTLSRNDVAIPRASPLIGRFDVRPQRLKWIFLFIRIPSLVQNHFWRASPAVDSVRTVIPSRPAHFLP